MSRAAESFAPNVLAFPRSPRKPGRKRSRPTPASIVVAFPKEKRFIYNRADLIHRHRVSMHRMLLEAANLVWNGEITGLHLVMAHADFYKETRFVRAGLFAEDRDQTVEYLGHVVDWMRDGGDLEAQQEADN